jgi:hypothetical protein
MYIKLLCMKKLSALPQSNSTPTQRDLIFPKDIEKTPVENRDISRLSEFDDTSVVVLEKKQMLYPVDIELLIKEPKFRNPQFRTYLSLLSKSYAQMIKESEAFGKTFNQIDKTNIRSRMTLMAPIIEIYLYKASADSPIMIGHKIRVQINPNGRDPRAPSLYRENTSQANKANSTDTMREGALDDTLSKRLFALKTEHEISSLKKGIVL